MSERRIPVAAGLVILYVALLQATMLLPVLMQLGLDLVKEPVALGLLLAMLGLIAVGGAAIAERSLTIPVAVWLVGCVIAMIGFATEIHGGPVLLVACLQQVGGPLLVILLARMLPASTTPLRRELGAALVVVGLGGALGAVWSCASTMQLFGDSTWTVGSLVGVAIYPAVSLSISALAVRAGRRMLHGHATASRALAQWMWITIAAHGALAVLGTVSFLRADEHHVPLSFVIQPLISFAFSSVMPLVLGYLGRRALAVPVEPRDAQAVPTVFAWAAAWLVPTLVCAAFVVRTSFVAEMVGDGSATRSDLTSAGCGVAAIVLLGTAVSVLRAAPIARVFARIAAMLSLGALCWFVYVVWMMGTDRHNYVSAGMPVGAAVMFTTAMLALAWFEGRREHDLAPARVIDSGA